MKRLIALSGVVLALLAAAPAVFAQSSPPPLPAMTPEQSSDVQQRLDSYRKATDARAARGEITSDEANRLTQWREWQLAQQAAGRALPPVYDHRVPPDYDARPVYAVPPDYYGPPGDYYRVEPPSYYGPYYPYAAPYYWGPRPYAYWGPAICAGGFGRHFGGRICF